METIKNQLKDSEKIVSTYRDYFARLDPLISGQYDDEHQKLEATINALPKYKKRAQGDLQSAIPVLNENFSTFEKDIRHLVQLYGSVQRYYNEIQTTFDIFDSNYLSAPNLDLNDMSKTYKLETMDLLNDLRVQYMKFAKKNEDVQTQATDTLANLMLKIFNREHEELKPHDIVIKSVEFIQNLFKQAPSIVSLYAGFMQNLIDHAHMQKQHSIVPKLLHIIEQDKNFILAQQKLNFNSKHNNSNKKSKSDPHIHHKNPPLKTFGFVPATDLLPMGKLIGVMLQRPISGKISLPAIAKTENACLILLTRMTYFPMEYNIRTLINAKAADGLIQDPAFGITAKIIERFNVIRKPKNQLEQWEYKYQIVGNWKSSDIKRFYVIETIDKKLFRLLVPWVGDHSFIVSREKVARLLAYITEANKPDRSENYHAIQQQRALRNMFVRRVLSTDIIEENSKDIDTQIMRNTLMLKIWQVIENIVDQDFDKGKKLSNNIAINKVIHDERILNIFQSVVLMLYKTGTKTTQAQEYTGGKFPFYELLSSYISELQYISRRFMKELHDAYNRDPLDEELKLAPDKRAKVVMEKINDVLSKTINLIINDKQNIYTALNYKYLILNFN